MSLSLRLINIAMISTIALFFSLVSIDNMVDYNSNWLYVQHVLSMDTTFQSPSLMQRAILNPQFQQWIYWGIISWEIVVAFLCWLGCFALLKAIKKSDLEFNAAKNIAFIGLFLGFLLYMLGFIIIGGEWFSMWQSELWNGQTTAGLFASLILFIMIFIKP